MSRTRIKFCGIRRPGDLDAAIDVGADAIGLILVPASPRYVTLAQAARLRAAVPPFVSTVVLVKDADAAAVQDAIDALKPDLVQFHGSESADFCESFNTPYLKAVAMGAKVTLPTLARRYRSAAALLLDSHAPGGMGGSGQTFAWQALPKLSTPVVLAGGLNPGNVGRGITTIRPYAVDVSSGVEARPGIKDHDKMRAFVAAVRRADQRLLRGQA